MISKNRFLTSTPTRAWIGQFAPKEQELATEMLRKMLLVSRNAFNERIIKFILDRASHGSEPIGLYAERELPETDGVPHPMFEQAKRAPARAHGPGPQPVQTPEHKADVGSEGIVAQLVSELCRRYPKRFLNHPGPDQIRKFRMRRFILVTDFIGSGKRTRSYLDAAWRVRSVRSWWSSNAKTGLSFEVVAYSGTDDGIAYLGSHSSEPKIHIVAGCPTVRNSFSREKAYAVREMCERYCPGTPSMPALGFRWTGALIAFAHGAPNNTPLIFHKRRASWLPLFPRRVTSTVRNDFPEGEDHTELLHQRLLDMRQSKLVAANVAESIKPSAASRVAVLAAAARPPRTASRIALKTGLTLDEVEQVFAEALKHGWVDGRNRLTDAGQGELEQLRKPQHSVSLPIETEDFYCPKQLRAPMGSHS